MKRTTGFMLLTLLSAALHAADRPTVAVEEEAKALIGLEHEALGDHQLLAEHLSCRYVGSGTITLNQHPQGEWSDSLADCQGRFVMTLDKLVQSGTGERRRWRIVDAVLLPPALISKDADRPEGPYLYNASFDDCTLDGRYGTSFYALVRHGKRDRMTWRSGVAGAWGFDLRQGRIVALSLRRVVCQRPDPEE